MLPLSTRTVSFIHQTLEASAEHFQIGTALKKLFAIIYCFVIIHSVYDIISVITKKKDLAEVLPLYGRRMEI